MYRKLPLILLILLTSSIICTAQNSNDPSNNDNNSKNIHFVGINAGTTTGLGFSYMYWPTKNGIQATLLPLIDKNKTHVSIGCTFLHKVRTYENIDIFIYWGNHFTNIFSNDSYVLSSGLGPGIHFTKDFWSIQFMVGYGIYGIPSNIMTRPAIELGGFLNL